MAPGQDIHQAGHRLSPRAARGSGRPGTAGPAGLANDLSDRWPGRPVPSRHLPGTPRAKEVPLRDQLARVSGLAGTDVLGGSLRCSGPNAGGHGRDQVSMADVSLVCWKVAARAVRSKRCSIGPDGHGRCGLHPVRQSPSCTTCRDGGFDLTDGRPLAAGVRSHVTMGFTTVMCSKARQDEAPL